MFCFLHLRDGDNTHPSSKVKHLVTVGGSRGGFEVEVRIGPESGGQGVLGLRQKAEWDENRISGGSSTKTQSPNLNISRKPSQKNNEKTNRWLNKH